MPESTKRRSENERRIRVQFHYLHRCFAATGLGCGDGSGCGEGVHVGADLETDWTVGGPIFWRGEYEGKPYQDKGQILDVEPAARLVHTHFSPLGGEADEPQNYHTLTWIMHAQDGATQLTLTQDNNPSADAAQHSQGMWDMLLADVKRITESR